MSIEWFDVFQIKWQSGRTREVNLIDKNISKKHWDSLTATQCLVPHKLYAEDFLIRAWTNRDDNVPGKIYLIDLLQK